jgi:diazepam-binding inhibitor (GABA receptor modulating acyl-CoA-binding protein)
MALPYNGVVALSFPRAVSGNLLIHSNTISSHQEDRMSTDLQSRFQQAAEDSKKLPKRPDNNTMLKLYSLYKQSTVGDVTGSRPGGFDMEGKMKYDAWAKQKGKAKDAAMQEYVDLVESLKAKK